MIEKENQSADYTGFSLVSGGFFYNLTTFLRNENGGLKKNRTSSSRSYLSGTMHSSPFFGDIE